MTAPNRATLWGRALVDEFAAAGVEAVCVAPGSRSTPLTVAAAEHPDVEVFSHLDERAAAFFALGRGRRTGTPTPVVCTSGTAAANLHPAVIEADAGRVPFLALTADRPAELQDSGANQTVDQTKLYGDAVRWYHELPEPAPEARRLRSVRVAAARAVAKTEGANPGPVHLNVPLAKPLEPTPVDGGLPADLGADRQGPTVATTQGTPELAAADRTALARALEAADRGLIVTGPANGPTPTRDALADLAGATGFPVLADPLSGHRFGHRPADWPAPLCGGYDSFIAAAGDWPDPDLVLRFGASPTSKALRHYLREADCRQVVLDPAGGWPEAEFTATDLVAADPTLVASGLAEAVDRRGAESWRARFADAEAAHWDVVTDAGRETLFEGAVLATVAARAPDPSTLYVSNSMPVRDLDRFGRPREAAVTALGNRGASGIDGMVSSALGAGSATEEPLLAVLGDLAYYHDLTGLLAVARCGVDATLVLVNNDGGGIFHALPIEDFDPPFTELFRTPHGLDFAPTGDLFEVDFERVADLAALDSALEASLGEAGTRVLEVAVQAEASHRRREALHERVLGRLE